MKAIWDAIAQKAPDGNLYIQWRDRRDIEYLYETGFVDTDKHSLNEWVDSFRDSLRPNGAYWVSQEQWYAKSPYRFSGITNEPFNPLTIREGEWTIEEMNELIDDHLLPSCMLKRDHFEKMLEKGREMGRFVNGKYIVNKPFKFGLKQLLETYASPKRRREVSVSEARRNLNRERPAPASAEPQTASTNQKTAFSKGPSWEKTMTDQLSKLVSKERK